MIREPEIIDQLSRSEEYQDFERAFCETTWLSLRLRALESCDPAGGGEWQRAQSVNITAVPVRLGDKTIGLAYPVRKLRGALAVSSKNTREPAVTRQPPEDVGLRSLANRGQFEKRVSQDRSRHSQTFGR